MNPFSTKMKCLAQEKDCTNIEIIYIDKSGDKNLIGINN